MYMKGKFNSPKTLLYQAASQPKNFQNAQQEVLPTAAVALEKEVKKWKPPEEDRLKAN